MDGYGNWWLVGVNKGRSSATEENVYVRVRNQGEWIQARQLTDQEKLRVIEGGLDAPKTAQEILNYLEEPALREQSDYAIRVRTLADRFMECHPTLQELEAYLKLMPLWSSQREEFLLHIRDKLIASATTNQEALNFSSILPQGKYRALERKVLAQGGLRAYFKSPPSLEEINHLLEIVKSDSELVDTILLEALDNFALNPELYKLSFPSNKSDKLINKIVALGPRRATNCRNTLQKIRDLLLGPPSKQ